MLRCAALVCDLNGFLLKWSGMLMFKQWCWYAANCPQVLQYTHNLGTATVMQQGWWAFTQVVPSTLLLCTDTQTMMCNEFAAGSAVPSMCA